ncbi:O-antigen polymerase, partial [Anaerocolumna aminovalerica]|uniref:O-antigen polymerase n=1 Tax=Anaerocolumna aminovalerica TaxID=1527 RepID=UPI00248C543B
VENSSVENSSVENSSVENSSVENSTENNSVECSPAENDSSEYDSAETSSVESSSVENDSSEYDSIESSSVESNSVENDSVENDSVENDSVENSVENNSTETDSEEYPPKEKDSPEKETLVHDVLLDTDEASELNESENNRTHNEEYPENSNTEHSPIYNPEDAEITTPEEENHLREDFNISDMEKEEEYLFDQEEIQDFYDEDPRRPEKTQTYIKKEEQYKDLISSAFSFLVISILGILILVINAIGFISIFNGTMTYIVMGGLFLIFLYIGITTLIKSNKVKGQISEENQVTDAINLWLSQNITKESLNELVNPKDTEEIQFMQKIEKMKELVIKQFGELDDLYLDRITEEYYNNHFDE